MPEFTSDWFSYHIPRWQIWLSRFVGQPNLNFMEIGCYEGRSTIWLLENVLTDSSSKITCLDWFWDQKYHEKNGRAIEEVFYSNTKDYVDKITIRCGKSLDSLLKMQKEKYDFIYIDGSHEQTDLLTDIMLSFRILNSHGIMVMDDYFYKAQGMEESPDVAIDAFLNVYKNKYKLIYMGCQVAIEKCSA